MNEEETRNRLYEIADRLEELGITAKLCQDIRDWIANGWVFIPKEVDNDKMEA